VVAENAADWMSYLTNPKGFVLRKFVFDMLKERYQRHEKLLERVGHYLVTEADIKEFGQLLTDIYEVAYLKAVADHKDALARIGLKVNVVPEKKSPA
jgi:hypothetical protein